MTVCARVVEAVVGQFLQDEPDELVLRVTSSFLLQPFDGSEAGPVFRRSDFRFGASPWLAEPALEFLTVMVAAAQGVDLAVGEPDRHRGQAPASAGPGLGGRPGFRFAPVVGGWLNCGPLLIWRSLKARSDCRRQIRQPASR